jgi:hypothetical protein
MVPGSAGRRHRPGERFPAASIAAGQSPYQAASTAATSCGAAASCSVPGGRVRATSSRAGTLQAGVITAKHP